MTFETRQELTIADLLDEIAKLRKKIDKAANPLENPFPERSFVSVYHPIDNADEEKTINGENTNSVTQMVHAYDIEFTSTYETLLKLLAIKEEVNHEYQIVINSPINGQPQSYSIAQLLTLKSENPKKYLYAYLNKLQKDYDLAKLYLNEHNKKMVSTDIVDRYVLARFNGLNIAPPTSKENNLYQEFAKEYTNANKMELLDPLNLEKNLRLRQQAADDFYDDIERILRRFNNMTSIWIDFSQDPFWGKL